MAPETSLKGSMVAVRQDMVQVWRGCEWLWQLALAACIGRTSTDNPCAAHAKYIETLLLDRKCVLCRSMRALLDGPLCEAWAGVAARLVSPSRRPETHQSGSAWQAAIRCSPPHHIRLMRSSLVLFLRQGIPAIRSTFTSSQQCRTCCFTKHLSWQFMRSVRRRRRRSSR